MSKHLGDFAPATIVYLKFNSFQPSTGVPFSAAGTPAVYVYKNNSTTESNAGVTLSLNFDARTGLHHLTIDTSADGTFYASGSFFDVVLTAGTVDGVSAAGTTIASFTLGMSSGGDPWATALPGAYGAGTAGAIVGGKLDATVSSRSTYAGADTPGTATLLARLTSTRAALLDNLDAAVSGLAAAVWAVGTRTLTSFGFTVGTTDASDIAAIKAKTDNLPASPAAVSDVPTANANADALLDRAAGVETNRTVRQALRLMLAILAGKLSGGATTTVSIRDTNDTKDRIVATVDASGNRTAITYDQS